MPYNQHINFSYIVFWWKLGGIININYLCCNKIDN